MVKKVVKFFAYFIFFIAMFLYFIPKVNLYYLLEEKLQDENIIISSENVVDNGFTLSIDDADISVKSISSGIVSKSKIGIFFIYNYIDLEDIRLSSALKSFIPLHIDNIHVVYSVFNPLNIQLDGIGDFGRFSATFNIFSSFLHFELEPSKLMKRRNQNTLRNFKKAKEGEFIYEQTF